MIKICQIPRTLMEQSPSFNGQTFPQYLAVISAPAFLPIMLVLADTWLSTGHNHIHHKRLGFMKNTEEILCLFCSQYIMTISPRQFQRLFMLGLHKLQLLSEDLCGSHFGITTWSQILADSIKPSLYGCPATPLSFLDRNLQIFC